VAGVVTRIDACKAGVASVILGAGRSRKDDRVLPGVGLTLLKGPGDAVRRGEEVCLVHGDDEAKVAEAMGVIDSAYDIGEEGRAVTQRVLEEIAQA
jgi:thymidine phosphorylase